VLKRITHVPHLSIGQFFRESVIAIEGAQRTEQLTRSDEGEVRLSLHLEEGPAALVWVEAVGDKPFV